VWGPYSAIVESVSHEKGKAMKQDVASGAVKVAPPVAAWLFGLTLNDWVAIGTLIYLALQGGYLLWRWYRETHQK
jgi:hypothetical protein